MLGPGIEQSRELSPSELDLVGQAGHQEGLIRGDGLMDLGDVEIVHDYLSEAAHSIEDYPCELQILTRVGCPC